MSNEIRNEDAGVYTAIPSVEAPAHYPHLYRDGVWVPMTEEEVTDTAIGLLVKRLRSPGEALTDPVLVTRFLKLRLAEEEREQFLVIFLDQQHRVIETEVLFSGTIDSASIYPREVVKASLRHNAAAVILSHNHPSGVPNPSNADRVITKRLKDALALVDVRVLDHIIIGGSESVSFAQERIL